MRHLFELTNLRLLGLICGIIGLIAASRYYRRERWERTNFFLLAAFSIFLVTISISPDVLNGLRDIFALKTAAYGRIIALLIISNLFLFFYIFYIRARLDGMEDQFDLLIRKLSSADIARDIISILKGKGIVIIIPAYNEEDNIRELLPRIPDSIMGREVGVLVLDDGSTDSTVLTVREMGFLCLEQIIHRGQGAVNRLGYDLMTTLDTEFGVTMDADNQHRPEELHRLIERLANDDCDLVIGSRMLGAAEKASPLRFAGVIFFSRIISWLLGIRLTDCSSGYKAFNRKWLERIKLRENQFQATEVIINTVKKGLRISEVPITMSVRMHGHSKKGPNLKYALHFTRVIIKTWLK